MGFLTDLHRRALRYYELMRRRRDSARRAQELAYGEMSARYYRDSWERWARAIDAEVEDMGEVFLKIRKGHHWTFVQRHLVMLDTFLTRQIVDNKSLVHRMLADFGWHPPSHLVCDYRDLERARRFMDTVGKVVVKPRRLSRGDGVSTNIDSVAQLSRASTWAASFDRSLIVEEHVEGDLYRLLFLDGDLIATVRRDPPSVVGDGIHTIRDLVRRENMERLSGRPATSLIPLTLDLESDFTLRRQALDSDSVPPSGQRVQLKSVINQNAARENHTIRAGIDPSIIQIGQRFASALSLRLYGLDLITTDIEAPLGKSGGALIEINTQPGLHYHDLVADESTKVPVGTLVLEAILMGNAQPRWCS